MKRYYSFFVLVLIFQASFGQRNADYGVFAGVSSYIGDINTNRLLYSPLPAAGVFYRYNLHPRQAVRLNAIIGGVEARDRDFHNAFQQARRASFSGEVGELSAQFEFNFFNYSTFGRRWNFSPYIAGGAGAAVVNTVSFAVIPVIPMSVGLKINIYKNLGLEIEYGFRKTFYDNFDGLKDFIDPKDHGWLHDNDWYSFTGIGLTWKMYNRLAGCPAYADVDSRRKK
ncbi:MAG TPA: DUF6089 family protein [Bacteroidales bacterium]|nr:DUF6089 family protein [Bacteroidales bacterium]